MVNLTKTGKKVKYVGTEEFVNVATGEVEEFQVTKIEDRDYNFTKVWMRNFITTLEIIGNQKTKFCYWIIDNINRENQLIGTQRQLAERSGLSLQTVNTTIGLLMDADFLRKTSASVYTVNPDIVFKGTRGSRLNVLNQYYAAPREFLSDEAKLQNVMNSIKRLETQAAALRANIEARQQNEAHKDNDKPEEGVA